VGLALTNPNVQRLRRLLGRRSLRVAEGALALEGAKLLDEALDAGVEVDAVFVSEGAAVPAVERAASLGIRVHVLAAGVAERVGDTVAPQSVFATARWASASPASLRVPLAAGGFVLVGVGLQDPGNAGTVIRSAEAAGAAGVVLCAGSVDATNPKTVRASAGALFHAPVVQVSDGALAVVRDLQAWGVACWATSSVVDGGLDYDRVDLCGPTAVLLGNEANGLPADVVAACDGLVTIPMVGRTESLNVAMTAAVLAFEAARQRRRSLGAGA
jgi:TrmH family RNA methyltransferase